MAVLPSIDKLREELSYCAETGDIRWLVSKKGQGGIGSLAGGINKHLGYRTIGVHRCRLYAHRVAWALSVGSWPQFQIDHINGDRQDNRLCNLRAATHAENQQNSVKKNRFGLPGVDRCPKTGRYRSRIVLGGKKFDLGYFETAEAASLAYLNAKKRIHPLYNESR